MVFCPVLLVLPAPDNTILDTGGALPLVPIMPPLNSPSDTAPVVPVGN
jgi:hypothetical protein